MISALLVMIGISLLLGAVLGFSAIKFKVEGNPLVEKIDAVLPQTQCGQCGYPGCKPYAEAIAKGEADINKCPPGGEEGIRKLAELLGVELQTVRRRCRPQSQGGRLHRRTTPASAARCACRPARWMPSSARPNRCTPSSPPNAPAANCASRPARWIASACSPSAKTSATGSGATRPFPSYRSRHNENAVQIPRRRAPAHP